MLPLHSLDWDMIDSLWINYDGLCSESVDSDDGAHLPFIKEYPVKQAHLYPVQYEFERKEQSLYEYGGIDWVSVWDDGRLNVLANDYDIVGWPKGTKEVSEVLIIALVLFSEVLVLVLLLLLALILVLTVRVGFILTLVWIVVVFIDSWHMPF